MLSAFQRTALRAKWLTGSPWRAFSSSATPDLLTAAPGDVVKEMLDNDIERAYLVWDDKSQKVVPSHPMFQETATWMENNTRDFHKHEGVFLYVGSVTRHLMSAAIHNTTRGPGAGGVRLWSYDNFSDYVTDGLRLSQGMGRKNSLAGLWWGGGKGVIARQRLFDYSDKEEREQVFVEYGEFMTSLRGPYITAEDLGVTTRDMLAVFSHTRFTTCIPVEVGGSGNPSVMTGYGVACAIEAAFDWMKAGNVAGKTFAVQGGGNVSTYLVERLLKMKAARIIVADISQSALDNLREHNGNPDNLELRVVEIGDNSILFEDVDCVCPCATGGTLNPHTIPLIKAKLVCGAANNQLLNDTADDVILHTAGKVYVPDFLANRMGIVNCSNEQYGSIASDPAILRHFDSVWPNSIWCKTQEVLTKSFSDKITTAQAANKIADNLMREPHPIWPDRSRQIIASLVQSGWDKETTPGYETASDEEE